MNGSQLGIGPLLGSRAGDLAKTQLHTPETAQVLPPRRLSADDEKQIAALIASEFSPLTAELAVRREIWAPKLFLRPTLDELPRPFRIPGVGEAVAIVAKARKASPSPSAFIVSDFDVDGVTSAAIVASAVKKLGFTVTTATPCRQREGYGLNERLLKDAVRANAKVLFLLDIGTSQKALVERAQRLGLSVVIIDHHLCKLEETAKPDALINPKGLSPHCSYMSAGGLAYIFALALSENFPSIEFPSDEWLGLATVSTIADVVPLIEENRALVKHGLKSVKANPGLAQLSSALNLKGEIGAADIAFKIAPCMNAPGRIAERGADVVMALLTGSESEPQLLIGCNNARKKRTELDLDLAERLIAHAPIPRALVVADDRFDPGVVGLVAARLVERYHRPAVVIAMCERLGGRGSVRGTAAFHVHDALARCAASLIKFGGHEAAGGLTIRTSDVAKFTEIFIGVAEQQLGAFVPQTVAADFCIDGDELLLKHDQLLEQLKDFEPFGSANPSPVWLVPQVKLSNVREVAGRHLKLDFKTRESSLAVMIFNNPRHPIRLRVGEAMDIGVRLSRARLSGESEYQSRLVEFVGLGRGCP